MENHRHTNRADYELDVHGQCGGVEGHHWLIPAAAEGHICLIQSNAVLRNRRYAF